jgi:hypothetical protein
MEEKGGFLYLSCMEKDDRIGENNLQQKWLRGERFRNCQEVTLANVLYRDMEICHTFTFYFMGLKKLLFFFFLFRVAEK